MKVSYSEGLAEVTVEGVLDPVKRGQTVEVTDEIGRKLLEQGWTEDTPSHHKRADSSATKKEKE